ncbi:MAG: hypothetical protein KKA73_05360, partial [Chloroflexi bacterium]|nr:hypothetical protein [Chloroflexota bacterium]MBU1747095.1 hypothetical protein [Chloroflexota bacterium]
RARRELDLQLALSTALQDVRDWSAPERATALARAYQLGQRLGEPARLLPALRALAELRAMQGQPEQALALAQQFLRLAEQAQEPVYVVFGHDMCGRFCAALGDLGPAREHVEQALALYRRQRVAAPGPSLTGEPDEGGVSLLAWLPYILWLLGYPDQALARSREAVALAHELALAPSLALALTTAGAFCHIPRREVPAVRECTERLQRLVLEKNLTAYQPWVNLYQGWLLAHGDPGQAPEGIARIRAGMADLQAFRPYQFTLLAGAYWQAGQVTEGLQMLDEALALVEQTGARSCEAEMHRLRGELLLSSGQRSAVEGQQAEACFQRAIEVARWQEAKSLELRAATSLARLWQGQGKREEAHALLAEVYGWFTEGFDTPDVVEARALSEALSSDHDAVAHNCDSRPSQR